MLRGNVGDFTPATSGTGEPYVALRLLAMAFTILAAIVIVIGGTIGVIVVIGSLGAAGAAARFTPGAVPAGIAGAGLLGGLAIFVGAALQALVLWAIAQGIRLLLSIEGHSRESAGLQRAMLFELRRSRGEPPPAHDS